MRGRALTFFQESQVEAKHWSRQRHTKGAPYIQIIDERAQCNRRRTLVLKRDKGADEKKKALATGSLPYKRKNTTIKREKRSKGEKFTCVGSA